MIGSRVTACAVPEGSLLAEYGTPKDYRDCFERIVPGEVTLPEFIERFYCSAAFLPERVVLAALGTPARSADARALAQGEAESFGAWKLVERREARSSSEAGAQTRDEALLLSKETNTASWFAVEPVGDGETSLRFGSWVGNLNESSWRFMEQPHVWYSRWLQGGVKSSQR
ncbi:hypothetical protein ACI5KX_00345 [Erythrobacter sp. GH1-10]|uniref:hypothetical protein n=1 Tax=Erythrobacter sp. GH1-10 TaxID=3349334 RepID=UPI0038782C59